MIEVLLVHPGGPFWRSKDEGAWSIPKGEVDRDGEAGIDVARREFQEEIGAVPPGGDPVPLGDVRQAGGKLVQAWALPGDLDVTRLTSNTFRLEVPRGSGRWQEVPEVDRAGWFDLATARRKLNPAQCAFIDRLESLLAPS